MCFIKKDKKCEDCFFVSYNNDFKKPCGLICRLNPFRPVNMGWAGRHIYRKDNKKEQYSQKKNS